MEKEFISYEQALALKELGFDEECFWWYDFEKQLRKDIRGFNTNSKYFMGGSGCSAPLYQQAFRWFREKYDLCVIIDEHTRPQIKTKGVIGIGSTLLFEYTKNGKYAGFEYEEAELECLKKLIEIVKNK